MALEFSRYHNGNLIHETKFVILSAYVQSAYAVLAPLRNISGATLDIPSGTARVNV